MYICVCVYSLMVHKYQHFVLSKSSMKHYYNFSHWRSWMKEGHSNRKLKKIFKVCIQKRRGKNIRFTTTTTTSIKLISWYNNTDRLFYVCICLVCVFGGVFVYELMVIFCWLNTQIGTIICRWIQLKFAPYKNVHSC